MQPQFNRTDIVPSIVIDFKDAKSLHILQSYSYSNLFQGFPCSCHGIDKEGFVSSIQKMQLPPYWLSFLNGQMELLFFPTRMCCISTREGTTLLGPFCAVRRRQIMEYAANSLIPFNGEKSPLWENSYRQRNWLLLGGSMRPEFGESLGMG